jgi:glycerophosphoryl diester phosphodiesterase
MIVTKRGRLALSQVVIDVRKKRKKLTLFFVALFFLVVILFLYFHYSIGPIRETKPFFEGDRPLVIAHQGGELLAPSNTIIAFDQAYKMGVDVLEFDIHMTSDGYLVAIHDATVDRTTNGSGRVDSYTLSDLQKLDAGYFFKDLNGEFSYRGKGAYIPSVEEIFERYPDIRMNIEIKDSYPKNQPSQIEESFWKLIQKYNMEDKVLVASFSQDIINRFNEITGGKVAVSAPREETKSFVITHKSFLNGLYKPTTDAFQIPMENSGLNLTDKKLIKGAHKLNMDVHYWTIDDPVNMRMLLENGVDGIITNRPDILIELMKEMGY